MSQREGQRQVGETSMQLVCFILQIRKAELQLTQLNNHLEKHKDEEEYTDGMLKTIRQELKNMDVSATPAGMRLCCRCCCF